jgi:hypothetical protein
VETFHDGGQVVSSKFLCGDTPTLVERISADRYPGAAQPGLAAFCWGIHYICMAKETKEKSLVGELVGNRCPHLLRHKTYRRYARYRQA